MSFDPIELAKKTEKIVCKDLERKYYRFRPAKFYGGIATADCVGCNLRCIYCWAWNIVNKPDRIGKFYSSKQVAEKLTTIAKKAGFSQLRVSGNEPTIGKEHLFEVLNLIPEDYLFILETNGILIGHNKDYAKALSEFPNLHVRVSLKGSNAEEFSKLTGANPSAFYLQLKALKNLEKAKVKYHPAIIDLAKDLLSLKEKLKEINPNLPNNLEIEPLIEYPAVMVRLRKANLI